ncbi:MAG: tyrosine--tRNA ligase [Magnetococcales bacterium]|nr:tyrosine--tRNA ligase [Magnetococcales bacterium]
MKPVSEQMQIIRRGAAKIVSEDELEQKLRRSYQSGQPLRIKAGFDPTAPDLHLGHTVLLQKLRQFQLLGHQIYFLIGDFTGLIGDPTGKNETRKPLTVEQVAANAATYQQQVFRVLDPATTEVVFNSSWMNRFSAVDLIQLAAKHTVARMMERDDFSKRYHEGRPIAIHEFLYPLIQGYDSVFLKADVELGGTDQTFNLLIGREMQREYGQEPQCVLTMPILEGTDGVQKMSKSLKNYIGIQEAPSEIFGKAMSISDALMWRFYELLSNRSSEELMAVRADVAGGRQHPMQVKKQLAWELVARFHDDQQATAAQQQFEALFENRTTPEDIPEVILTVTDGDSVGLASALRQVGIASSNSDGMRLIRQGAIMLDQVKVSDERLLLPVGGRYLVQSGRRRFSYLKVVSGQVVDG